MSKFKKSISESSLPVVDETLAAEVSSLISDKEEISMEEPPTPELKETPKEQVIETVSEEVKAKDQQPEKARDDLKKVDNTIKNNSPIINKPTGFLHGGSIYRGII